jgi:YVTN family beta-propeller protein
VIDGASNQVITTVATGSDPHGLCHNPQDNKVYCANQGSANVSVIDGASNQVITTVATACSPWATCYNPQDNKVYCANRGSGNVTVIDGASDSAVKTITVGIAPCALTHNPAQNRIYVANYGSNSVSIIRDSALGLAERAPFTARRASLEAYPNPFSGQTRLRLTANGLRPNVRIYDVNGALVRAFRKSAVRSSQLESLRFLTWDGTDGMGRRVPPGIYFCALDSGTEHLTRKLVLLP